MISAGISSCLYYTAFADVLQTFVPVTAHLFFSFYVWILGIEVGKNKEYIDSQHTEAHKRKYIKSGTYARKK